MSMFRGLVVATPLLLSGCVLGGTKDHFVSRGLPKAAFDMGCPAEQIEVTELGHGSMGVRGCGKQGRYEFVSYGSKWVLNAAVEPVSGATPGSAGGSGATEPVAPGGTPQP